MYVYILQESIFNVNAPFLTLNLSGNSIYLTTVLPNGEEAEFA